MCCYIVGSPEKEVTHHIDPINDVQTVAVGSHPATPNFAQPVVQWTSPIASANPGIDLVPYKL